MKPALGPRLIPRRAVAIAKKKHTTLLLRKGRHVSFSEFAIHIVKRRLSESDALTTEHSGEEILLGGVGR